MSSHRPSTIELAANAAVAQAVKAAVSQQELEAAAAKVLGLGWNDPLWRLANLYWIVDDTATRVRLTPNEEQWEFVNNLWTRNLILKARQLGFSTLMAILELDQAIFNANYKGSVIADTLGNAGQLFSKVEYAYDNLPEVLRAAVPVKERNSKSSIVFGHIVQGTPAPSSVTVSVSSRGGTLQLLHVSELGKISRRYPQRAEEIVSGAFPSVPSDGIIVVESTAEGSSGEFYDLCKPALDRQREGRPETALDYRLHFFPWYRKAAYRLSDEDTAIVHISEHLTRYFRDMEAKLGVKFDPNQRAWYAKTQEVQKRRMKREYPTTPEEAFEAAIEGAIYGEEMTTLREAGRLTSVTLDHTYPVNTFWDLGSANTFIWLHQNIGLHHRFVKTFGGRKQPGKGIGRWWRDIEEWRREREFLWGKHFLPHDAATNVQGDENKTLETLMIEAGARNTVVLPRIAHIDDGIEMVRNVLDVSVWIDREACEEGWLALDAYQHEWDDVRGTWTDVPLHNWASHPADGFRQFGQALSAGLVMGHDVAPSVRKHLGRQKRW